MYGVEGKESVDGEVSYVRTQPNSRNTTLCKTNPKDVAKPRLSDCEGDILTGKSGSGYNTKAQWRLSLSAIHATRSILTCDAGVNGSRCDQRGYIIDIRPRNAAKVYAAEPKVARYVGVTRV